MMTIMCSAVYDSHDKNMGLRNHKYATLYGSLPYTFIEWVVGGWGSIAVIFHDKASTILDNGHHSK